MNDAAQRASRTTLRTLLHALSLVGSPRFVPGRDACCALGIERAVLFTGHDFGSELVLVTRLTPTAPWRARLYHSSGFGVRYPLALAVCRRLIEAELGEQAGADLASLAADAIIDRLPHAVQEELCRMYHGALH